MKQDKFIEDFKTEFIDSDQISVDKDTKFRNIGSWDSMTGMAVLVMIKDKYGVDMSDKDLIKCNTVQDIIDFIMTKQ